MKNKRILCAALLAAAASLTTGCQKEEVEPEVPATPAKGMPVYVEAMTGDTKLRTLGLTVEWENGDQILIGPDNYYSIWNAQKEVYNITVSGSDVSVDYTPDATAKVAFFPKNLVAFFGGAGVIGAKVPSEYTVRRTSTVSVGGTVYNRNHIDLPMFAQMPANPSSITFQHLTGCIYLYVKNPTSKALILDEVELSHSRKKLCGTVEFASMDQPINGTPEDRTVKVVYPDGLSIPAGGEVRNVQVPVLPIDASNNGKLTLKIKCHTVTSDLYYKGRDVHVFEYTATSPTVARNQLVITKVNFDYENDPNNRITTTKGGFGLSEGRRVFIAATNLKWKATTSRDDAKFTFGNPASVWYCIGGNSLANTTDEYSGSGAYETDLFGYGTNGWYRYTWSSGGYCTPDLKKSYYAYYPDVYLTRANYDWGRYTIYSTTSNSYSSTGWYTLSTADWKYMLCDDNEYNDRRAWGKVANQPGIILLPDNYVHPEGLPAIVPYEVTSRPTIGETMAIFSYTSGANEYTTDQFTLMRQAGAVFLGKTGWRDTGSDTPYKDPSYGCYWGSDKASIYFGAGVIGRRTGDYNRAAGYAVRLARDVE